MNPLFNSLGGNAPQNDMMQQFAQFRENFSGDPRQQVQQLLNSGRMTQQQYNELQEQARRLMPLLRR